MKTRLLIIIGITAIAITTIVYVIIPMYGLQWWSTYDPRENPYGVEARIMIQSTYFSSPIEPKDPIEPQDVLWLRYNTKHHVDLREFEVCNGLYCIAFIPANGPPSPELSGFPEKWAGITLGDLPWKIGDTVHIWTKASPVDMSKDGYLIHLNEPITSIDLGELKIIRGETIRN